MATNTIGASSSGNSSVSSRAHDANPKTTRAIIVTTVMIGRLIAKSEMNMLQSYGFSVQLVSLQEIRLFTPYPYLESTHETRQTRHDRRRGDHVRRHAGARAVPTSQPDGRRELPEGRLVAGAGYGLQRWHGSRFQRADDSSRSPSRCRDHALPGQGHHRWWFELQPV